MLKQIHGSDLVGAYAGRSASRCWTPSRQPCWRGCGTGRRRDPLAALSDQERHILELIGEGLTNRQIGERMYLAEKTVKNYVSNLLGKLDMQRRTQAAAYAAHIFGESDPDHGESDPNHQAYA